MPNIVEINSALNMKTLVEANMPPVRPCATQSHTAETQLLLQNSVKKENYGNRVQLIYNVKSKLVGCIFSDKHLHSMRFVALSDWLAKQWLAKRINFWPPTLALVAMKKMFFVPPGLDQEFDLHSGLQKRRWAKHGDPISANTAH